jgi:hypothetical protein
MSEKYCLYLLAVESNYMYSTWKYKPVYVFNVLYVTKFIIMLFTEYGTVLTTILPILFLYLNTVIVTAGAFEL